MSDSKKTQTTVRLLGVRVVVDDCLPQGEARLVVSTTDEVRLLVNFGDAEERLERQAEARGAAQNCSETSSTSTITGRQRVVPRWPTTTCSTCSPAWCQITPKGWR